MTLFRLTRRGGVPLEFEGRILADETSRRDDQPRWSEVRLYLTDNGAYVSEVTGRSILNGERDLTEVRVTTDPAQVREDLMRKTRDGKTYLTDVALLALTVAADEDPHLRNALVERI